MFSRQKFHPISAHCNNGITHTTLGGNRKKGFNVNILISLMVLISVGAFESTSAAEVFNKQGITQLTNSHNTYRYTVGLTGLTWSKTIETSAIAWANELEKNNCKLEHSSENFRNGYGENLYSVTSFGGTPRYTPRSVVTAWGKEKRDYNINTGECFKNKICGHYTQIVWRDTIEFGCAKAVCKTPSNHTEIVVCQYNPAGNYTGEKAY